MNWPRTRLENDLGSDIFQIIGNETSGWTVPIFNGTSTFNGGNAGQGALGHNYKAGVGSSSFKLIKTDSSLNKNLW